MRQAINQAAISSSAPFFSIITVVYNDVSGLSLTKSSIESQTFPDFEWIVVDGGSKDGTVDFLKHCDQPGLSWVSEKDKGIYDAMNKGIKLSRGEYLVFLNAGDVLPGEDTLFSISKVLFSDLTMDVLFGGAEYVFADGRTLLRSPKLISTCIWHGLPANHQATYYSRKIMDGLLYDLKYKICGDYFLIASLYRKNIKAAYMDVPLVKFSVGGMSYVNRVPLFFEPYMIQRDILRQPFFWRVVSLLKRGISTLGMIFLQNIHRVKIPVHRGA